MDKRLTPPNLNMKIKHHLGFTLVEIAIALVIIGLVLSAFLTPLGAQLAQSRNNEARKDLSEIKEALLGYAVINGRLPCPDTSNDGLEDACVTNTATTTGGNVPWVTLNTKQLDPWQRRYQYRVNNGFTGAFSLATQGSGLGVLRVCTTNACVITEASNVPLVIFSMGQNGAVLPPVNIDEQENTDGDRDFVSRDFSNAGGGFDDIVVWLSANVLMSKMVTAGRLP
jgi:prepilin-type N-terminal cleavage/methylation domain-containing protein